MLKNLIISAVTSLSTPFINGKAVRTMNLPSLTEKMYTYQEPGFKFFQINNSGFGIRIGKSLVDQIFVPSGPVLPISKGFSFGNNQLYPYSLWIEDSTEYKIAANTKFFEIFPKIHHHERIKTKNSTLFSLGSIPSFCHITKNWEFNEFDLCQCEVNLMSIEANAEIDGHTHPVEVYILVLEGRYLLTLSGYEEKIYYPGDIIHIQANLFHTVRSVEAVKVIEFWDGVDFWDEEKKDENN